MELAQMAVLSITALNQLATETNTQTTHIKTMQMTKSFPPADDLIAKLQEIDYPKQLNSFMDKVDTIVVWIAAIVTVLWEKFQTMKITTPDKISQLFYFNINMRATQGDEIVGLSVGNRYIGLYNDSLNWGVLDENGCL
jgi:hypothetical protein